MTGTPISLVVLISGNGSNLQAIMDAIEGGELPARIRVVISNQPEAYGLERARRGEISTAVLRHRDYPERTTYDAALQQLIDHYQPDLVVLAGFMRILTPALVAHYAGRMLIIHPSLLPAFTGLDTHQRAIDASATEHGASVHFVTAELDSGPVIIQARVPVSPQDTATTLAAKVHTQEHRIYPLAIRWFAQGRIRMQDSQIFFDGQPLRKPIDYSASALPD